MTIPSKFRIKPGGLNAKVPTRFKNHNLMRTNPNTTQFEPTEASPIRQHKQMAGDPVGPITPTPLDKAIATATAKDLARTRSNTGSGTYKPVLPRNNPYDTE